MATLEEAYNNFESAMLSLETAVSNCDSSIQTLQSSTISRSSAQASFLSSVQNAISVMNEIFSCTQIEKDRICETIGIIEDAEDHSDAIDEVLS